MKNYPATNIRNVALLGHGGSGKTAFAEAVLFNAKVTDRLGKSADGNTVLDFDPEEIRRKISINTAVATCEWKNCKLNLLDTPGDFDFVGEVMQSPPRRGQCPRRGQRQRRASRSAPKRLSARPVKKNLPCYFMIRPHG